MKRFGYAMVGALALAATFTGAASAQNAVQRYGETDKEKTPAQLREEQDAQKAYNKSLQNIPEQKSADPWGAVRSDNTPKAAAPKAAAPKTAAKSAKPKADGATAKQ